MWSIYAVHKRLWLSNTEGWVEKDRAAQFTWEQKTNLTLPFGGIWIATPVTDEPLLGFRS